MAGVDKKQKDESEKAPVKKERKFKVGQRVKTKSDFRLRFQCFNITVDNTEWIDPESYIKIPKGTELTVVKVNEMSVTVEFDMTYFSIELDVRKDMIK